MLWTCVCGEVSATRPASLGITSPSIFSSSPSPPLIAIGKCMGAFSLAYPEPFLEHNLFGKGFNMQALLQQLVTATVEGVTCGNVLFVVDIIIPVLAK